MNEQNNLNGQMMPTQDNNVNTNPAVTFNVPGGQPVNIMPEQQGVTPMPAAPAPMPEAQAPATPLTLGQVASTPVNPTPAAPNPVPVPPVPETPVPVAPAPMGVPEPVQPSVPQPPVAPAVPSAPTGEVPQPPVAPEAQAPVGDTPEAPKKKPIALIVIAVLLLLLAGGAAVYYFVIDNPKTIFTAAADKLLKEADASKLSDKYTIDYDLSISGTSGDGMTQAILNVINEVKLSGTHATDSVNTVETGTIKYKEQELFVFNAMFDGVKYFVSVPELYEKVISLDTSEEQTSQYKVDVNDYTQVYTSLADAVKTALDTATYKKELVTVGGEKAKKLTLTVDKAFITNIYNKLSKDSRFLECYARIAGVDTSEVSQMLTDELANADVSNTNVILYLTMFSNEFLKVEFKGTTAGVTIEKKSTQYNFEITDSSITKYRGYVKVADANGKQLLTLSLNLVDYDLQLLISSVYSITENKELELFDVTDAIDYQSITEEEIDALTEKVTENEALATLVEDIENAMSYDETLIDDGTVDDSEIVTPDEDADVTTEPVDEVSRGM